MTYRPDDVRIDPIQLSRIITPVDLEELFRNSPGAKIINQGDMVSTQLNKEMADAIFDRTDDVIPFIPSCEGGCLKGKFYEGLTCSKCGTVVTTEFIDHLAHQAWLSIPENMPPVLHPVWYHILKDWTRVKQAASLIELILDASLDKNKNPTKLPEGVTHVITGRGFSYFYQNVDTIMQFLFSYYAKKKSTPWVRQFYLLYRDIMFTTKLPILHSSLHPMVKGSSTLKYADPISRGIVKAAYNLSAIAFKVHSTTISINDIDISLYGIYRSVIDYYVKIISDKLGTKYALLRKHCLGTRCHFTSRSVIVPISGAHRFDEVHLPWKLVVNTFKLEIINVLANRYKLSTADAESMHISSLTVYNKLIHDVLLTLMDEHPYKAFPFLIGRNPTLRLFSIQLLYCTHIKTDVHDETIGISPGNVTGYNADFDGDEMWLLNIKESAMVAELQTIHPRETVLDTNSLNVSTLITPTKQTLITMQRFLSQNPDTGYLKVA